MVGDTIPVKNESKIEASHEEGISGSGVDLSVECDNTAYNIELEYTTDAETSKQYIACALFHRK